MSVVTYSAAKRKYGVTIPHVVSPEATGGEVTTPPIVPKTEDNEGESNE